MDRESLYQWISLSLKIGLGLALLYVGADYVQRMMRPEIGPEEKETRDLHPDLFVHPPKSYVTTLDRAEKLVGEPLWVKEGYRWEAEPGGRPLEPFEKIVPKTFVERDGEALLIFEKDGREQRVVVGAPQSLWIDEMFFIRDPREMFDHWSDQDWEKIESREAEEGMSEYQVTFALGAGQTVASSGSSRHRVVEYRARQSAGLPSVRVAFRDFVAVSVEPLEE